MSYRYCIELLVCHTFGFQLKAGNKLEFVGNDTLPYPVCPEEFQTCHQIQLCNLSGNRAFQSAKNINNLIKKYLHILWKKHIIPTKNRIRSMFIFCNVTHTWNKL